MKTISRYIMTLALLLTAASGAWAEDDVLLTTVTATSQTTYSQSPDGIVTVALSGIDNYIEGFGWVRTAAGTATVTVEATEGYTITRCVFKQNADNYPNRVIEDDLAPFVMTINGGGMFAVPSSFVDASDGQRKVTDMDGLTVIEVYGAAASSASDIEVITNAAEEGATFTEATFAMPAYDATADYELVRDMGYKVAFNGVPTRARLAKDGNGKFHFADGLTFQLLDNIDAANPKDITSAEGITFMVGEVEAVDFEGHTFYQLNKETLVPLDDFLADAHLGNYAICAVASTGEYDGSFASGMITLFQGYEVEVAAKEFITYYKDEPLRVEDEAAELYTVSSVNGDKAVLSDKSDAMPSNTPMLVYNNSDETKVILLIPCNEPDLAITVAPEFKGTLTGTTIAASTEAQTNYALNGKQFVFVKNDIPVAANKAWLSFETFNNAKQRSISIVFEEGTTELDEIKNDKPTDDTWYDLNGRKLDGEPTTKGVFIKNGKKVMR